MDIALKFKRAVAVLSAGVIFASTFVLGMGNASAAYSDVPAGVWYGEAVAALLSEGILDDSQTEFRGADPANRAEVTAMVMRAIDGLVGFQAPTLDTYKDVVSSQSPWYYSYVEGATQLGIVNGYTDPGSGLPTGFFGPSDNLTRAALTKIVSLAFELETILDPAQDFSDVPAGAWYTDYVTIAKNNGVVEGYPDGTFGPGLDVNRAELAVMIHRAMNPTPPVVPCDPMAPDCFDGVCDPDNPNDPDCEEPPCPADDPNCVPPSDGTLEVSLDANTPNGVTVPLKASAVPLFSFDLTAVGGDVTVSQIVIDRSGVGNVDDWDALYLYEGTQRRTTERNISADTNQATFPIKNLVVGSGKTVTLTLVGDVSATAVASSQHAFSIFSADELTTNAKSVSGDFVVMGDMFTIGSVAVSDATISKGPAPVKAKLGEQQAEVASFKIQAGAEDILFEQVTLNQGGTLSSDNMTNCTLLRGTDELATGGEFMGDLITFVLDQAYVVDSGQTRTFYVDCDIIGGNTDDTAILYLEENADLHVIDAQYGFGANVINNFTQNLANTVLVEGGDLIFVENGPVSTKIARNTTNNELLNFSATANRDLVVQNTFIQIDIEDPTGAGPSLPASGTGTVVNDGTQDTSSFCMADAEAATFDIGDMLRVEAASGNVYLMITDIIDSGVCAGANTEIQSGLATGDAITTGKTATELDPFDSLTNVRLVDMDSNTTLVGPMTDANTGATLIPGPPSSYSKVHTEDYDLFGGVTRNFSIQADVGSTMPSGYKVRAQVRYSDGGATSYIKDFNANEVLASATVIGAGTAALPGDYMFTATNSLDASLAASPTSQSYVKGAKAVPALGVTLEAGDAGDATLKRLDVRVYADAGPVNTWGSATGDTAGNTVVNTVSLYDGDQLVAGPKGITLVNTDGNAGFNADSGDYYRAQFDGLDMLIPASQTKTLVAKVDLLDPNANTFLALDVAPATDITAEDSDGNSIAAGGATNLNPGTDKNPELTILAAGGTLTANSVDNPDAMIMVAGASKQNVANYNFVALDEDFMVETLSIVADTDGGDFGDALPAGFNALTGVTVEYTDQDNVVQSVTKQIDATGVAKFTGLDLFVPAGEEAPLNVFVNIADKAGVGEAISGKTFRIGLRNSGNTDSTFRAIGQQSNQVENFTSVADVTNSANVNEHVVRVSVPTITKVASSATMGPGENTLYSFTVAADSAGSVRFGRFVFDVEHVTGGVALDSGDYRFFRGAQVLSNVNIIGAAAGDLTPGNNTLGAGPGSDQVIVSFNTEESISAGSSRTYSLKATPAAAVAGDIITASFAIGDENVPVASISAGATCGAGNNEVCSTGNGNTGLIYDSGANEALFVAGDTEFSDTATAARNIIWSDNSADGHVYPTVAGGTVTQGTGSYDWTNGYLLGITDLASQSIEK